MRKFNYKKEEVILKDEIEKVVLRGMDNIVEIHLTGERLIVVFGILNSLGFFEGEMKDEKTQE